MTNAPKPTPNQRLRNERERRCWSQQELADMVGTTPLNVGRWERGVTQPGPHFRQKLCEVFEKNAQQLGLVPESADIVELPPTSEAPDVALTPSVPETPLSLWNIPYNRNLFFTGREDILLQIYTALAAEGQPQAISGLGGIGKTQTAVEYAYRFRGDYDAVLWARADSYDLLVSDFLLIAALLNLPQRSEQVQNVVVKAVLRWFDSHERWLLILDNADQLEMVSEFIPSSGKGQVLLTTRAHSTGTIAQRIEIEKMDVEEGMLFLLRRMKRLKGTAGLESLPGMVRSQAQAIVEAVDGLPLAIDQAGAYIDETGCTIGDYLKFYKTRHNRLLRMRGHNATGHPEPVATTWSLSFEKVERANPAAAELLRLCAFLHPDEIPESMIVAGASELGPILQTLVEDELDLNEVIGELRKYSLVKRDPEKKMLNIHRLVQVVIKDALDKETRREWAERAVRMVNKVFPIQTSSLPDVTTWHTCQQLLPHVQVCVDLISQWNFVFAEAAFLTTVAGGYLNIRGRYAVAEPLLKTSLAIREQIWGAIHLNVAIGVNDLGWYFYLRGKYDQAEQLFQQSLSIREQILEASHQDVAKSLINLGVVFMKQGKYVQAEQLMQRAISIGEEIWGSNHISITVMLNNLAALYGTWGKYEQAEPLHQRALLMREQIFGPDHPSVAESLTDIALLYQEIGKYEQSVPLLQRALAIREKSLLTQHPELAETLSLLAQAYSAQNKYEQAEALFLRAFAIYEPSLGLEHPLVLPVLERYAELLQKTEREAEAESMKSRVQAIRAKQE